MPFYSDSSLEEARAAAYAFHRARAARMRAKFGPYDDKAATHDDTRTERTKSLDSRLANALCGDQPTDTAAWDQAFARALAGGIDR